MDVRSDHRQRRHANEAVGCAGKNPVEGAVLEIAIRDPPPDAGAAPPRSVVLARTLCLPR